MTNIASIVPDTHVPVAQDLLKPSAAQQVTPVEDSVSSFRSIDGPEAKGMESQAQHSGSAQDNTRDTQAGQAAADDVKGEGKPSGILPIVKVFKGPRGGIHWGAGQQSLLFVTNKIAAKACIA